MGKRRPSPKARLKASKLKDALDCRKVQALSVRGPSFTGCVSVVKDGLPLCLSLSTEYQIKKLACSEEPQCVYECAVCRLGILLYTWSYLTSIVYDVDRWACFRYLIGAPQSPEEYLPIGSNWGGGISVFMVEYIFLPWSCKILQAKFSTPLNWASSTLNLILISIVFSTVLTKGACLSAPGLWNKYCCTCNKHPHLSHWNQPAVSQPRRAA